MRKLFKKVLAVVLMGAMLGSVGCKDYDDDINKLNDRLDEIEGTVALKTDVQALQSTVNALNSIDLSAFIKESDFAALLEEAGVAFEGDLKAWLTSDEVKALIESYGFQSADDVKALIAGLQDADDVKATFEAMLAAYDIWGAVEGDVAEAVSEALAEAEFMTGESALSDAQMAQVEAAIIAAFGGEGDDVKAAIDAWLGDAFAAYMKDYTPTSELNDVLGINKSVEEDIAAANEALKSEIMKAISEGESTSAGLAVQIAAVEEALAQYKAEMEAIAVKVAELEGRIQSLVWVPATYNEVRNGYIQVKNTRLTLTKNVDGEDKTRVVLVNKPSFDLTYQVTPASACEKIKPEHLSIAVEAVTRAMPTFTIEEAVIADGKIKVTVAAEEDLYAWQTEEDKYPMIALHVQVPAASEEMQGIDFLSPYTMIQPNRANFNDAVKFVHGEEGYAFNGVIEHKLDYTNKEEQIFLCDGFVGVEETDAEGETSFVKVVEAYDAFAAEGGWLKLVCTPEMIEVDGEEEPVKATPSSEAIAEYLTLNADGFAIKESNEALIGESVSSGRYTYTIEDAEGYSYELGTIKEQYDLQTTTVELAVAAQNFTWTYANAVNTYKKEAVNVAGVLNAARYNAVKALMASNPAKLYKGDEEIAGATVSLSFTTTPTADSDAQQLTVEIVTEAFAEGGNYEVKGEYLLDDCLVELTIPVTVKGMPVLKAVEVAAAEFVFDGLYTYTLIDTEADFMAQLWAANEAVVAGQITEEEFETLIAAATFTCDQNEGKADLSVNADEVVVRFEAAALNDAIYMPVLNIEHSNGLKTALISKGVSLVSPAVTFTANPLYVVDGKAKMITSLNGSQFTVEQKSLAGAYSVAGAEGLTLVYEVANDEESEDAAVKAQAEALTAIVEDGGAVPAISGELLSWNDWTATELIINVKAMLNGVEMAATSFVAYIVDPVAEQIALVKDADLSLYAGEEVYVASKLELLAGEKNIFAANGLDADLATALGGKVTYAAIGEVNSAVTVDETNGTIAVADSAIEIVGSATVKVKVTYIYQFGERTFEAAFTVKAGTRPAPETPEA